jgi:hypothetical protein
MVYSTNLIVIFLIKRVKFSFKDKFLSLRIFYSIFYFLIASNLKYSLD